MILKPFIHPATSEKIKIFASNEDEWKAALLEEIDADQLPAFFGGTLTENGDPKCPSKFNMGGSVPKSYYLTTSAPVPKKYMDTLNVIAGGKKKLKFKVDDVNSILRYLKLNALHCTTLTYFSLSFKLGIYDRRRRYFLPYLLQEFS